MAKQGDALLILEMTHVRTTAWNPRMRKRFTCAAARGWTISRHVVREESNNGLSGTPGQWMMRPHRRCHSPGRFGCSLWLIGVFVAQTVVEITEEVIMGQYL